MWYLAKLHFGFYNYSNDKQQSWTILLSMCYYRLCHHTVISNLTRPQNQGGSELSQTVMKVYLT